MPKHNRTFLGVISTLLLNILPARFKWVRRLRRVLMFALLVGAWVKDKPAANTARPSVPVSEGATLTAETSAPRRRAPRKKAESQEVVM